MWRPIESGAWFTRERLYVYTVMLVMLISVSLIAAVAWIALADGLIARDGQPIGTDFSNVFAAGKLVLAGEPSGSRRRLPALRGQRARLRLALAAGDAQPRRHRRPAGRAHRHAGALCPDRAARPRRSGARAGRAVAHEQGMMSRG